MLLLAGTVGTVAQEKPTTHYSWWQRWLGLDHITEGSKAPKATGDTEKARNAKEDLELAKLVVEFCEKNESASREWKTVKEKIDTFNKCCAGTQNPEKEWACFDEVNAVIAAVRARLPEDAVSIAKIEDEHNKRKFHRDQVRNNTASAAEIALYTTLNRRYDAQRTSGSKLNIDRFSRELLDQSLYLVRECVQYKNVSFKEKEMAQADKCGEHIRQLASAWKFYKDEHAKDVVVIDCLVEVEKKRYS